MSETLRKLAHNRFIVLIDKAQHAPTEEERRRSLKEADNMAAYIFQKYSLADFAAVVGA